MNLKFTGPVIDIMTDRRGTAYLIVEASGVPQKVKCWGRGIDAAARAVRVGDVVAIEARLSANRWQPPNGGDPVWFDGLQATFLEVQGGHAAEGNPTAGPPDDSDIPF